MKAHIGVDADSGLVHTVQCSTAKVADITMMEKCLHGEEAVVLADRGYHKRTRTVEHLEKEGGRLILTPSKRVPGGELSALLSVLPPMMRISLPAYIGNGDGAHGFSPGIAKGKVDYENLSQQQITINFVMYVRFSPISAHRYFRYSYQRSRETCSINNVRR
jgi:hypothetical protein